MDYETVKKEMGLSDVQSKDMDKWISESLAKSSNLDPSTIEGIVVENFEDAVEVGLNAQLSAAGFLEFLMSSTSAKCSSILPPAPGVEVEMVPIGFYPTVGFVQSGELRLSSKIVAFVKILEENREQLGVSVITAYGNDAMSIRNSMVPYELYKTVLAINMTKRGEDPNGVIRGSIHPSTSFNDPVEEGTIEARKNAILSTYPMTTIVQSPANTSNMISIVRKDGSKSNPFTDQTDLKIIQGTIADYVTGRNKNGIEWGKFGITDSTFMPTAMRKNFAAWIDPNLVRVVGAGVQSFVKVIGAVQTDRNGEFTQMSVCSMTVDRMVPLVEGVIDLSGQDATATATENVKTVNFSI